MSLHPLRSFFTSFMASETLTSTVCRIRAAGAGEFTFAVGDCDCWRVLTSSAVRTEVARNGHRATRDVRRMRKVLALRGALQFRPRRGRRRVKPDTSLRWGLDVTMLEISQGSRASSPRLRVLQFRRPFQIRLVRVACLATLGTCQLCARSKRRSGSPSVTRREAESKRRETVQVEGRHPYLVARAAVLGVGEGVPLTATLHAYKSRDKGV